MKLFVRFSLLGSLVMPFATGAEVDYKSLRNDRGDMLPDFSFCGYHSSNSDLPDINSSVDETLSPTSGDQSSRIQSALDNLAKSGGGILLLQEGNFELQTGLKIPNNTVLRGSGNNRTFLLPKFSSSNVITLGDAGIDPAVTSVTQITDTYVPIGASKFNVQDTSRLTQGQKIMVQRAVTESWVRQNGMSDLVRDGQPQTWIPVGTQVRQPRKIKSISGKTITLDIPLTDAINSKYMQGEIATFAFPRAGTEMGVENLAITMNPTCSGTKITSTTCSAYAVWIPSWTTDSWVRDVNLTGFGQFVMTQPGATRITLDSVQMNRDRDTDNSAGYPADISVLGTQILVRDCSSYGSVAAKTFPVVSQNLTAGPNAVVNFYSQQSLNKLSPHQRWGHGFLVDNSRGSIQFDNRGTAGTGQGWSANAAVAWNIQGSDVEVSSPPLGINWCIGCRWSRRKGNGTFVQEQVTVQPTSLFQAQLAARGK